MFFNNFESIKTILITAFLVYFSIIIILRTSGKRTLSSLNAFDFVVTVTIGSIAATTILSVDTSFADGLVGIASLVILQYIMAKLDANFKFVSKVLKSDPTLLFYNGKYLEKNMKKMRITQEDIIQQVRLQSCTAIEGIQAVILESNGSLSVISGLDNKKLETFKKYE